MIPELVRPWAKHNKHGTHALVCHLIDTMEVAHALYPIFLGPKVRRELEETFAPLEGDARGWVALLCGLHDLGKYTPAFQSLVLEVAKARFPAEHHAILAKCAPARKLAGLDTKHGLSTALHMAAMLEDVGAGRDTAITIGHVLGGHHGWFPEPGMLRDIRGKSDLGDRTWREARSSMVCRIAQVAELEFDDFRWSEVGMSALGAIALAGLTTISDWVASDSSFFPYESAPDDLPAYRERARTHAARALAETGWSPWRPREGTGFTDLFEKEPRPVQTAVEKCLENCVEPGVLVVEAPTGEGKTKAGLYAAARLASRLGLGGLYLATPTKELSRQARDDVRELLTATGSDLDVNLVYSGAAKERSEERRADERKEEKGRSISPAGVGHEQQDGEESEEGAQDPREWFTRKKGLAFPVGVGTVDQALKSVIRSGHNFLGMTALGNKVVLIDEVHSYDAYTGLLVQQLMWFCGLMGVPVVLMSATLTGKSRCELIEQWRAGAEGRYANVESVGSPRAGSWQVTWSGGTGARLPVEPSKETAGRGRVRVERGGDSPQAIAQRAVAEVGEEGTALVVLNTVRRAGDVRDRIAALLDGRRKRPELVFFTGDHKNAERLAIRDRLAACLGKDTPRDRHAIVVGTQVLEHGLDMDADLLISDLCPIDLLFQRVGRLHRHNRPYRPERLRNPVLVVADVDPAEREARPPSRRDSLVFTAGVWTVYSTWLLGRSRVVLGEVLDRGEWDPLKEIGGLIHRVYADGVQLIEKGWENAWARARESHRRQTDKRDFHARSVMVSATKSASTVLRLTERSGPAGRTRLSHRGSGDGSGGPRG
ncbi:CRISPR-associated helicase Cas3' [Nocardiopsis mangrovi]|uniref:CRISPR-associated helicase Cas3 n=1 Tax=Nocardiopsis mangrovi TaxID=1179818 RepID=A0ABV9E114_9ACTN